MPSLPDATLSFSAGSTDLDPYRFRVATSVDDRLPGLIDAFPELGEIFRDSAPLLINCYPATLGHVSSMPTVDTYLRPSTCSRALILATHERRTALLVGQPLFVVDSLLRHVLEACRLPNRVVAFVGGYPLPASAESFIKRMLLDAGCDLQIYHAYGVAEINFGILLGKRENDANVHYRMIDQRLRAVVDSGKLRLKLPCGSIVDTGDYATLLEGGLLLISNQSRRFSPLVLETLHEWQSHQWLRRTGHASVLDGEVRYQLRQGIEVESDDEVEHYSYWRKSGLAWTEKPDWRCPCSDD